MQRTKLKLNPILVAKNKAFTDHMYPIHTNNPTIAIIDIHFMYLIIIFTSHFIKLRFYVPGTTKVPG